MRKLFILPLLALAVGCGSKSEETVKIETFKDKLSYALGADQARGFTNSGDKNFDKYNLDEIVKGFEIALKDEKAFDASCESLLKETFGKGPEMDPKTDVNAVSLCIGKLSGSFFISGWKAKRATDKMDFSKIVIGFDHGLRAKDTLVKPEEQMQIIQDFIQDLNKINGAKLLEDAKKKPNTKVTSTGIVLEIIQEGTGGSPTPTDDVLAHYVLMNAFGDTLQSSFDMVEVYKQPLTPFSLKAVVAGWQEGIPLMKKGGKYRLYLPFNLAYGDQGMYNPQTQNYDIQPYESLFFYIELINYGPEGSLAK
jgi:FKBP-type peptidyl-prolyl cis-trans isomerase